MDGQTADGPAGWEEEIDAAAEWDAGDMGCGEVIILLRMPPTATPIGERLRVEVNIPDSLPRPSTAPSIAPLSVMGIGSWPRPRWLLRAIHDRLEGRLDDAEFQALRMTPYDSASMLSCERASMS